MSCSSNAHACLLIAKRFQYRAKHYQHHSVAFKWSEMTAMENVTIAVVTCLCRPYKNACLSPSANPYWQLQLSWYESNKLSSLFSLYPFLSFFPSQAATANTRSHVRTLKAHWEASWVSLWKAPCKKKCYWLKSWHKSWNTNPTSLRRSTLKLARKGYD